MNSCAWPTPNEAETRCEVLAGLRRLSCASAHRSAAARGIEHHERRDHVARGAVARAGEISGRVGEGADRFPRLARGFAVCSHLTDAGPFDHGDVESGIAADVCVRRPRQIPDDEGLAKCSVRLDSEHQVHPAVDVVGAVRVVAGDGVEHGEVGCGVTLAKQQDVQALFDRNSRKRAGGPHVVDDPGAEFFEHPFTGRRGRGLARRCSLAASAHGGDDVVIRAAVRQPAMYPVRCRHGDALSVFLGDSGGRRPIHVVGIGARHCVPLETDRGVGADRREIEGSRRTTACSGDATATGARCCSGAGTTAAACGPTGIRAADPGVSSRRAAAARAARTAAPARSFALAGACGRNTQG